MSSQVPFKVCSEKDIRPTFGYDEFLAVLCYGPNYYTYGIVNKKEVVNLKNLGGREYLVPYKIKAEQQFENPGEDPLPFLQHGQQVADQLKITWKAVIIALN